MLKKELKRNDEMKSEMNDEERAEVNACLVEQVSLPVIIISRSRLILKRESRFERFLERHAIKKTEFMCER